jgi:hypothetical protein
LPRYRLYQLPARPRSSISFHLVIDQDCFLTSRYFAPDTSVTQRYDRPAPVPIIHFGFVPTLRTVQDHHLAKNRFIGRMKGTPGLCWYWLNEGVRYFLRRLFHGFAVSCSAGTVAFSCIIAEFVIGCLLIFRLQSGH